MIRTDTSPHCEKQWPYSMPGVDYRVMSLHAAAYGAQALADLLQADAAIRSEREAAPLDEMAGHPAPLSDHAMGGIHAALGVCLLEIRRIAEKMEDCRITIKPK